jgi:hypothetical protein
MVTSRKISSFPPKINVIYSGGGFACLYGVLICYWLKKNNIEVKYSCVSGGTMVPIMIETNHSIYECLSFYNKIRERCINQLTPIKDSTQLKNIELTMDEFLPSNAHELCSNKVFIGVNELTLKGLKYHHLSSFKSKADLIQTSMASSTIPFVSDDCPYRLVNGKKYIDGIKSHVFNDSKVRDTSSQMKSTDDYLTSKNIDGIPTLSIDLKHLNYPASHYLFPHDKQIENLTLQGWYDFNTLITTNKPVGGVKWMTMSYSKNRKMLFIKLLGFILQIFVYLPRYFTRFIYRLLSSNIHNLIKFILRK